jgi:ribonuclease HIII
MSDFISKIEHNLKLLKAALAEKNDYAIDKQALTLQQTLLNNEAYLAIGDERFLEESVRLLAQCYSEENSNLLDGLRRHKNNMRAAHDTLYAILDPALKLSEVLEYVCNWAGVDVPSPTEQPYELKEKLHDARSLANSEHRLQAFLDLYFQYLETVADRSKLATVRGYAHLALEGYKRAHQWTAYGLFALDDIGDVYGIKIHVLLGKGEIRTFDSIDAEMEKTARRVMACVSRILPQIGTWDVIWEVARDDIPFAGNSLGLALAMGILSRTEDFDIDGYTAFTGFVEWNTGDVKGIEELTIKLGAARDFGIRRVFIPQENLADIDIAEYPDIEVIPVTTILQVRERLRNVSYEHSNTPMEQLANAQIRRVQIELDAQNIKRTALERRNEYCLRATFSDMHDHVPVDVFHSKTLKVVVGGSDTKLRRIVQQTCDAVFGAKVQPEPGSVVASPSPVHERGNTSYSISPDHQRKVEDYIFGRGDATRGTENNCIYRASIVRNQQTVFVRQYTTGKLRVDGPNPLFQEVDGNIRAVLGMRELPDVANNNINPQNSLSQGKLGAQIAAVEAVELGEQWIGTDESGKGDYYGPLVGAAVLVDAHTAELLRSLGIRDSKTLSDNRNRDLAAQIKEVCGSRARVVTIPPERYNSLYAQFLSEGKNLNTLLAWAHTRALESILEAFPQTEITVLVDKFADERYIKSKLLEKGRQTNLNLVQLPKAEANVAVAAASILARAKFLEWLERLSKQYGVVLPKGASDPRVEEVARQIVAQYGRQELTKIAKLHFKTTEKIFHGKMSGPVSH